jgi:hypothetical protein
MVRFENIGEKYMTGSIAMAECLKCLEDAIKANTDWRDAEAEETSQRRIRFANIAASLFISHGDLLTEAVKLYADHTRSENNS